MAGKIASFLFTLTLIGWRVYDIIKGRPTAMSWILLVLFSLVGLFELGDIFETRKKLAADGTANADAASVDAAQTEAAHERQTA